MLHLQITQVSLNQIAILFKPIWIADFPLRCSCLCCRTIAQCARRALRKGREKNKRSVCAKIYLHLSPVQFTMCHFWHSQCAAKQSTTFVVYLFRLHGSQHGRFFLSLVFFLSSISLSRARALFVHVQFLQRFICLFINWRLSLLLFFWCAWNPNIMLILRFGTRSHYVCAISVRARARASKPTSECLKRLLKSPNAPTTHDKFHIHYSCVLVCCAAFCSLFSFFPFVCMLPWCSMKLHMICTWNSFFSLNQSERNKKKIGKKNARRNE